MALTTARAAGPGNGQGGPGGSGQPPKKQNLLLLLVAALVTLVCMSFFMKMLSGVSNQEITYNEFLEKVDAGEVKSVEINDDQINIVPKSEESVTPSCGPRKSTIIRDVWRMIP